MQMLEKYFDTAFDAPDGIKKLRELILTLAMQGKLIQNGNTWEYEKLGNLVEQITKGATPTSYGYQFQAEGIPFIKVENVKNGKIQFTSKMQFISEDAHEFQKRSQLKENDILFSIAGTIGETCIVRKEDLPANTNQALAIIRGYTSHLMPEFLINVVNSTVATHIKNRARGAAMNNISLGDMKDMQIPVPPKNEQKRIVEKINQLMALCDELEKLKEQKEAKKLTVHKSAINQLLDSKDKSNSQKGWHFISNHFNDLYTVKENVSELRSAILQLAMQGKLVLQDTNDQPANELLKKLKKIKNISEVNSNEMSFSLPQSWKWERIVNLGITQTGTTPPKKDPDNYGNFIPFIGPGNIKNGIIDYSGEGLSEKGIEKGRLIEKDSILMVCIGGSIGKHAMTNQNISCNQQINTITVYPELSTQYIYWAMASQYFQNTVINQAGGSATPIINKLKWSSIPIPVPPYNEQQRIVEKINQLMALCDDLEKQIENSSSKQTELLNAIMSNLGK